MVSKASPIARRSTASISTGRPLPTAGSAQFTSDFRRYLVKNGFGKERWASGALPAFGGRAASARRSSVAATVLFPGTGADASVYRRHVEAHGTESTYAVSFYRQTPNPLLQATQAFSIENIVSSRNAIRAITEYTGTPPFIIGHSQGGLWAYAAAAGGEFVDQAGQLHDLGEPLPIRGFLGLAVPFKGVIVAKVASYFALPIADQNIGIAPGSKQLALTRSRPLHAPEGAVFALTSPNDMVVGGGQWTIDSCSVPNGETIVVDKFGHNALRDDTIDLQRSLVERTADDIWAS